MLEQLSAIGK